MPWPGLVGSSRRPNIRADECVEGPVGPAPEQVLKVDSSRL